MKPTEQPDICKTEWEDLLRHLASKPKKKKDGDPGSAKCVNGLALTHQNSPQLISVSRAGLKYSPHPNPSFRRNRQKSTHTVKEKKVLAWRPFTSAKSVGSGSLKVWCTRSVLLDSKKELRVVNLWKGCLLFSQPFQGPSSARSHPDRSSHLVLWLAAEVKRFLRGPRVIKGQTGVSCDLCTPPC